MNELLFVYLYSLSNQFMRGYVERLFNSYNITSDSWGVALPSFGFELCGKPMFWHACIKTSVGWTGFVPRS
jgi:hypothetical protein